MTTSRPNESELSAEVTAVIEANSVRMNWGGVVSPAVHLTLYLYCDTTTLPVPWYCGVAHVTHAIAPFVGDTQH